MDDKKLTNEELETTSLTSEALADLLKLEERATPGPWTFYRQEFDEGDFAYERNDDNGMIQIYEREFKKPMKAKFDAEFIAAARNNFRALIHEVQRLRKLNEDYSNHLATDVRLLKYAQESNSAMQSELAALRRFRDGAKELIEWIVTPVKYMGRDIVKNGQACVDRARSFMESETWKGSE